MNLLDDRSCPICHATFAEALVHCCRACGHSLTRHSDGMKCSICKTGGPSRFPWLTP